MENPDGGKPHMVLKVFTNNDVNLLTWLKKKVFLFTIHLSSWNLLSKILSKYTRTWCEPKLKWKCEFGKHFEVPEETLGQAVKSALGAHLRRYCKVRSLLDPKSKPESGSRSKWELKTKLRMRNKKFLLSLPALARFYWPTFVPELVAGKIWSLLKFDWKSSKHQFCPSFAFRLKTKALSSQLLSLN